MEPGPEPDLLIPRSCLVILCSIASLVKGNMLAVKVLKQREVLEGIRGYGRASVAQNTGS